MSFVWFKSPIKSTLSSDKWRLAKWIALLCFHENKATFQDRKSWTGTKWKANRRVEGWEKIEKRGGLFPCSSKSTMVNASQKGNIVSKLDSDKGCLTNCCLHYCFSSTTATSSIPSPPTASSPTLLASNIIRNTTPVAHCHSFLSCLSWNLCAISHGRNVRVWGQSIPYPRRVPGHTLPWFYSLLTMLQTSDAAPSDGHTIVYGTLRFVNKYWASSSQHGRRWIPGSCVRLTFWALRWMDIPRGAHVALLISSNGVFDPGPPLDTLYYT